MEYLKVTKVDDVIMYRRGEKYNGTLHLTTHHIIFTIISEESNTNEQITKKRPSELWFCYPMIERVDFNRGSALMYQIDPQSIDSNGNIINSNNDKNNLNNINSFNNNENGFTEAIKSSLLATTATELTNSLTNGLGFGNVITFGKDKNELRRKEVEKNETYDNLKNNMIQLSLRDDGDGVKDHNKLEMSIEKRQYEIESKQRKLCRGASLRIQFRDFNYISFDFKNILKCNDVFDTMLKLTCIDNIEKLYAFIYQPIKIETQFNSWYDYNVKKEFERQGLNFNNNEKELTPPGSNQWRITELNKNYELCLTYPKELIIPKNISDIMLKYTVNFRSKNRFPTLTYYYKKNGCCIVRCSQPLVGIKQNRSIQDENLIQEIFKTNKSNNLQNLIVDARPVTNAMAQVALGAGTEIMEYYGDNNKKIFLNIENIHVMRDSLNKVKLLLMNSDINNNQKIKINKDSLNKSNWLDHLIKILKATKLLIKKLVNENVNLIIHCSDGWDRTTQICSLIEICIDPYYRTFKGFIILIEKEWISFGHRFNERCGNLQKDCSKFFNNTEEGNFQRIKILNQRFKNQQNMKFESPIFQQFLDCIYQLLVQNPNKFEFNERFLRRLVYHLYSCQYGTFLINKEKDKYDFKLNERCTSVWDYFKSRENEFINKDYKCNNEDNENDQIIEIDCNCVIWWSELFGRDLNNNS